MLYRTPFGEAVQKILFRFGATEAGIVAIETLIQTAQSRVKALGPAELAARTCRGLHMDAPGSGVVCAKCFEAAMGGARDKAISGDELAAGKVKERAAAAPGEEIVTVPEPTVPTIDREEIARAVAGMLGEREMGGGR
jgi:hypothetical protein